MSLFSGPVDHAANPPESWEVVKIYERTWELRPAGATYPLQTFGTRYEAEAAREVGWLVDIYEKERRWYAGEPVAQWRPYAAAVPA